MNLLDHRVLIWNHEDYAQSKIEIFNISEFFDLLSVSLKANSIKISIDRKVFDEIFEDNSIPLGKIHEFYPELADIHPVLLSKISNLIEYIEIKSYDLPNNLPITPNIFFKYYTYKVGEGVRQSFNYILCLEDIHIFILMEGFADIEIINISNGTLNKDITVYNNQDPISEIIDGLSRIFEMSGKHDQIRPHPANKGDEVSILILSADEKLAQSLLIYAKADSTASNEAL